MNNKSPYRAYGGLLWALEAPTLLWLARRLPRWVTPDRLTALGFVAAVLVCFSYALSTAHPALLWIATLGLSINWFGDSLDGTLARHRKIERPRYGFYLDNAIDVLQQLMLVIGLAFSNILRVEFVLLGLIVFYMMSILTLIRAQVFGEFTLAYGGLGPTELRVAFVVLNAFVYFAPPRPVEVLGLFTTYPDLLSLTWIVSTLATFIATMRKDLRQLALLEPPLS